MWLFRLHRPAVHGGRLHDTARHGQPGRWELAWSEPRGRRRAGGFPSAAIRNPRTRHRTNLVDGLRGGREHPIRRQLFLLASRGQVDAVRRHRRGASGHATRPVQRLPSAPRRRRVAAETQAFWSEFRRAALAGDYKKIEQWTQFPLRTHTGSGFGSQPRDGFDRFFSDVMRSEVNSRAGQPGTMRALLGGIERLSPEHSSPDGEAFRVGALQFDLIEGRWRLTAVDLAPE